MNDRDRLCQLEALLARLERMPASAGRDWMLAEVRGRAVDVKTGMPPTPMRALPNEQPPPAEAHAPRAETAPRRAPVQRPRRTPSHHAPRGRVVTPVSMPPVSERGHAHEDVVDLLGMDGVLNLDDAPTATPTATGDISRPWARGLRG
jgi:hypothetical protein